MSSSPSLWRHLAWMFARPLLRGARNVANLHGSWRLGRLGYLDFAANRPAGALAPQGGDLWFLYSLVRARKPRLIIELGSGCSTVIFAQALYDNAREDPAHAGRIISLDGMAQWAEVTQASIPGHLAPFCDIRHVEAVAEDQGNDLGFRYEALPDGEPDFLYVDGPALQPGRKICFDALHLQDRFPPGFTMVVDGRHDTVRYLRKHLAGTYRVTPNRWLHNTRFDLLP
ncbi:MAG: hypothetical protein HOK30_02760 [Rhodospirillaceae bacterium]|nr:hypothetical protein [Rhodospirillaceae bacterium]MBT5190896.1 hypothetical protein [Rhodospirillaceae bacterium]MBT5898753.1 hypothetical protein [Rhodospirillaceae bacterium]MBT6426559.1 hypothetical protein [Rhodospirillaceae bacterium]